MLIIGSRAAIHHIPSFRTPVDWDIIASLEEVTHLVFHLGDKIARMKPTSKGKKFGIHLVDKTYIEVEITEAIESARMLAEMPHSAQCDFFGLPADVAAPHLLFLIKKAHIRRPIHWAKNIADFHTLKAYEKVPNEVEQAFYAARLSETNARVPGKEPSLAMSNSDFFRQKYVPVELPFPHDAYHWAVAYGERPVFYDMKKDTSKAWCESEMFDAMPLEKRLQCVREETMVISLERYLVPGLETDPLVAYQRALERVSTTLTSGWFREFAIEHWPLLNSPDRDFVALWNEKKVWAIEKAA